MSDSVSNTATLQRPDRSLFHCDALALVERLPTATVDLGYVDPPLFPSDSGGPDVARAHAMRDHILYLNKVLQHVRRALRPSGNLFVHSVPQMNGSVRLLLDQIFGRESFRQEIIVPRLLRLAALGHSGHDTVFFYACSADSIFNPQRRPLTKAEVGSQFANTDENGPFRLLSLTSLGQRVAGGFSWRDYTPPPGSSWKYSAEKLDELFREGRIAVGGKLRFPRLKQYLTDHADVDVGTVWDDLTSSRLRQRALLPTQKPEAVVDRLIKMGSHPSGTVLDPFCGSGTTLVAAQKANRRWIGCDNDEHAIGITRERLASDCNLKPSIDYFVIDHGNLEQLPRAVMQFARVITGFDDLVQEPVTRLVYGEPLGIEETREYEFKEVTSQRPCDTIANTVDEYAVAFLNSEGGRLFWGVRDSDRVVVGLKLTAEERNRLRQLATAKLAAIQPSLDPTAYRLEIHPVQHPTGIPDVVVVELVVPRVRTTDPFYTGGNEVFVRVDGAKRKLVGPALTDWIRRRLSAD